MLLSASESETDLIAGESPVRLAETGRCRCPHDVDDGVADLKEGSGLRPVRQRNDGQGACHDRLHNPTRMKTLQRQFFADGRARQHRTPQSILERQSQSDQAIDLERGAGGDLVAQDLRLDDAIDGHTKSA
jgi:hypothetical protein